MRSVRRASTLLLVALLSTSACADSGTGPDEPDLPSVAGTWTGDFRDGSLRLVLSQSGSEVTGTLGFGRSEQSLSGSVDAAGVFVFVTEPASGSCVVYSSSRGLQLENQGGEMNGVMVRSSKSPPCDEPGRTLVEQGSAALTRAF